MVLPASPAGALLRPDACKRLVESTKELALVPPLSITVDHALHLPAPVWTTGALIFVHWVSPPDMIIISYLHQYTYWHSIHIYTNIFSGYYIFTSIGKRGIILYAGRLGCSKVQSPGSTTISPSQPHREPSRRTPRHLASTPRHTAPARRGLSFFPQRGQQYHHRPSTSFTMCSRSFFELRTPKRTPRILLPSLFHTLFPGYFSYRRII